MLRRPLRESDSHRFGLVASVLLPVVAALVAVPGTLGAQESGGGPRLETLEQLDLPDEIARASDVRWLQDGELVVGVIGRGLYSWRVGEKAGQLRVALEEPEADVLNVGGRAVVNSNQYERDYGRLAGSPDEMAFTDLFSGIHLATEDGIDSLADLEHVGDLDRRGSLTAAVGLMRKDEDGWAEHAAWLIHDGAETARGLLPTRDGGRGLELCSDAELSVIRFISDDRLLVIPGAEPGVFVYDREGVFHDSLDAETFFAEGGCDIEANEWGRSPLFDAYVRADWLGQRRLIDEVVADGEGNVYFFVRYAAAGPAADRTADTETPFELRRRPAAAADIAATLPNTDPDCSVPLCYERAVPGRMPAGGAYDWRPAETTRDVESTWGRYRHHVALRSSAAARPAWQQPPTVKGLRRQQPDEAGSQPGQTVTSQVRVRAGSISDRVVASVPPPTGRVCWDLVHARVDDLRAVTSQSCVVESEFADTRLRADLRGDRAVILLRGGALRGADVRSAEAFEARVRPPAGAED